MNSMIRKENERTLRMFFKMFAYPPLIALYKALCLMH